MTRIGRSNVVGSCWSRDERVNRYGPEHLTFAGSHALSVAHWLLPPDTEKLPASLLSSSTIGGTRQGLLCRCGNWQKFCFRSGSGP